MRNWTERYPLITLKLLLRRLPKDYIESEIDSNTYPYAKGTPLCQVSRSGDIEFMKVLIGAGASLEVEIEKQGTPLIAACLSGQLAAVKYLVRVGANLTGTMAGKPCSALRAAREFPSVIHWLLVQQYTEQHKIALRSHDDSEHEIKDWSGPRSAEVIISGLYSPENMGSFHRVIELERLRRELRGQVAVISRFN